MNFLKTNTEFGPKLLCLAKPVPWPLASPLSMD